MQRFLSEILLLVMLTALFLTKTSLSPLWIFIKSSLVLFLNQNLGLYHVVFLHYGHTNSLLHFQHSNAFNNCAVIGHAESRNISYCCAESVIFFFGMVICYTLHFQVGS